MELTAEEVRVLGCLIEKEATTPDQYPLSTNALTNACNQKTSREPIVSYSEREVVEAMLLLRPAGLARTLTAGRAEKHRHVLDEALQLDRKELAVLAVMMLRGPQSSGELRTRTERAVGFESPEGVELVLGGLAARDEPLVRDLGRGSGQSQNRWGHLLGGEVSAGAQPMAAGGAAVAVGAEDAVPLGPTLTERVTSLEARIASLEEALGL